MIPITKSTLYSTFDLIKAAILANTTLAVKFNTNNIHQFEPKHKAGNFTGFPYIWIEIPENESGKIVYDNNINLEALEIPLFLRMDWEARGNALGYVNAIRDAITAYESTFELYGYYDVLVDLVDVDPNQIINQKQVVEAEFSISFRGYTTR